MINTIPAIGKDSVEQAFPLADHGEVLASGLTKRELFAVLAMQGLLASETGGDNYAPPEKLAIAAVESADALIKVLAG